MMVMAAGSSLFTYFTYRFLGDTVSGTVVNSSAGRDLGGRPGMVHEFKSRAKTHLFAAQRKGEKVFIHWTDPRKAIVNNLLHFVFLPLIFLAAGCYCGLQALFSRFGSLSEKHGLTAEEL